MNKTYVKVIYISVLILYFGISNLICEPLNNLLIMNGDTLYLYESPLKQIDSLDSKFCKALTKNNMIEYIAESCDNSFSADWIIIDNQLYITQFRQCYTDIIVNEILEEILDKKFVNGLLKADWVCGIFCAGKDIAPVFQLETSIFCHEYILHFNKGIVTHVDEKHYQPCLDFTDNGIEKHFDSHINWERLPQKIERSVSIISYIEINAVGKISDVTIYQSSNLEFNNEIIRVLNLLPCIPIYFNYGVIENLAQRIDIQIGLNKEIKIKIPYQ